MTILEIVDTAVKVGLGAIIGGMFTYIIAKMNHDKEMEKDRLRRRRELLEEIASKCDNFSKEIRDYWALLSDWLEVHNPEKELPEHSFKINESQKRFYNAFHDLSSAVGRLLLLGEKEASAKVHEYGSYAQRFYSSVYIGCKGIEEKEMKEYRNNFKSQYENIMFAISEIYKRNK